MKILIVHHSYAEKSHSGEDIVLKKHISFLKSKGHDIVFINQNTDEFFTHWYSYLTTFLRWPLNLGRSIQKIVGVENPDVIFIHNIFPTFSTRWIRKTQVPILMWIHNYRSFCIASTFMRKDNSCQICIKKPSIKSVYYRCSSASLLRSIAMYLRLFLNLNLGELNSKIHFITLSEMSRDVLLRTKIVNPKISVIPNFINRQVDSLDLIENKRLKWVYVGRLSREKGILPMIKLFPGNVQLDIYGAGPLLSEMLIEISAKPNIEYRGTFSNEEIPSILKNYIGAIIPSIWTEGLPTSFLEYCANGIPTITWKHNSSAIYVSKFQTGVVVNGVSTKELSDAIHQITYRRNFYSSNAFHIAKTEFDEELWYQKLMDVIISEIQN